MDWYGREPVSYTHLDVYKRQEELNVSEDIKKELRAITPHTYTGL